MKFEALQRQYNFTNNRLKRVQEKIEKLLEDEGEVTGEKLRELSLFYDEALAKHADFEKSLMKVVTHDKTVENYDADEISKMEDDISNVVISIKARVKPYLDAFIKHENSLAEKENTTGKAGLRLPPLALKTFNGSPEQWLLFYGLFARHQCTTETTFRKQKNSNICWIPYKA